MARPSIGDYIHNAIMDYARNYDNSQMYGSEGGDDNHHSLDVALLFAFALLICYIVFGAFAEHKGLKFIHETGFGIILGIIIGCIFVYADSDFYYKSMTFNPNFFMLFILPPIIFAGGYNLKKRRFFQNFFYITLFGFFGTLINFGIVLGLTFAINDLDLVRRYSNFSEIVKLKTSEIMAYSATICATDSVAALAMIKPEKYPKLFSVIFGEGMVNDAVSIIIFQTVSNIFPVQEKDKDTAFKWYLPFEIIGELFLNAFGAILLGIVAGLLCTLTLKHARFLTHSAVIETCCVFFYGYIAYMAAELCEWSGVIAILVAGISMSHYLFYNLSPTGKVTSGVTMSFLAVFAEAFLYIYLGISVWEYKSQSKEQEVAWSWTFALLEMVIVFIARTTSVFGTSAIAMLIKGKERFRLNVYELGMICYAGVIRGAIAFALIQSLPNPDRNGKNNEYVDQLEIVKSTTLFIVIFTTIVLGGTMPLFIQWSMKQISKQNLNSSVGPSDEKEKPLLADDGESKKDKEYKSGAQKGMKSWDERYFKRWFIYDYENRKDQIKEEKIRKKLKEQNPEAYIQQSMIEEELAIARKTSIMYQDMKTDNNLEQIDENEEVSVQIEGEDEENNDNNQDSTQNQTIQLKDSENNV